MRRFFLFLKFFEFSIDTKLIPGVIVFGDGIHVPLELFKLLIIRLLIRFLGLRLFLLFFLVFGFFDLLALLQGLLCFLLLLPVLEAGDVLPNFGSIVLDLLLYVVTHLK
jgi:hypothetical protein